MKLEITQRDIDNGEQRIGTNCAIAQSIKRNLNLETTDRVFVGFRYMDGKLSPIAQINEKVFHLPTEVKTFIETFDVNKSMVSPFSLEIGKEIHTPYPSLVNAYSTFGNSINSLSYASLVTGI